MVYITYNMGNRDLPDIYAHALGPAALRLGYIYQANPSCPCYNLYICYSYTMDTSGLPDMYTRSPRAAGPRAEGVHIRQTTSGHGITDMYHSHSLW